jgi:hypothetical protein
MAQRASSVEVLRILISIGPTESMHFQTWSDKAGNACSRPLAPLTDPTNGLTFPDLNSPPFGGETFQTNLIMPEPCPFLSRDLPICSIIRPTETNGIAMGVVHFLTAMGLFIGQSQAFFDVLTEWQRPQMRRHDNANRQEGSEDSGCPTKAGCSWAGGVVPNITKGGHRANPDDSHRPRIRKPRGCVGPITEAINSAELPDRSTQAWTSTGNLNSSRGAESINPPANGQAWSRAAKRSTGTRGKWSLPPTPNSTNPSWRAPGSLYVERPTRTATTTRILVIC